MLDVTFIRDNPDIVRAAIKNKNREGIDLDRLLRLADERRRLAGEMGELNRERNEAAAARDAEKGRSLKERSRAMEENYQTLEKEVVSILIRIPNIPSADTPIGPDESGNVVIREWGEKRTFDFEPRPHWDIGKMLGMIDNEKAAEVSGARFAYLKGDLVLLQFALQQMVFKTLTSKEELQAIIEKKGLQVTSQPFVPVLPPAMMRSQVMNRMARLDPIDDRFYFEKDDLVLIGSAEHTTGPLHMDQIVEEEKLPLRYVAYSTSFRREAGAAGKDTRGILRLHQFDKIEMQSFTVPESGLSEQEFLVALQEHFMQALGIPYRVVLVCTGDMGFPDQRQVDIESWMPGQGVYRETHSADYVGGFQARRLNTKVRRKDSTTETIHMNDATAIAMGRTLIAILENYQCPDGSVEVPEVLRSYIGKERLARSEA